jgi:hypothetical protein
MLSSINDNTTVPCAIYEQVINVDGSFTHRECVVSLCREMIFDSILGASHIIEFGQTPHTFNIKLSFGYFCQCQSSIRGRAVKAFDSSSNYASSRGSIPLECKLFWRRNTCKHVCSCLFIQWDDNKTIYQKAHLTTIVSSDWMGIRGK